MRALLATYAIILSLYLGTAALVSLFVGGWSAALTTAGAIAAWVIASDAWTRYRAIQRAKANYEAFKSMMGALGIDLDKLRAEEHTRREAAASARVEGAN